MSSNENEPSIFAKLEQIAGGVKLIDHKLDASNALHNERHERVQADLLSLRTKTHEHANALQTLFGWRHSVEGERKGLSTAGKWAWLAAGLIPGGVIVALVKMALGL
jgi:hypothetical protein